MSSPKRRVHKSKERKDSIGLSVGNENVWSADTLARTGPGEVMKTEVSRSHASWLGGMNGQGVTGRGKVARNTTRYPSVSKMCKVVISQEIRCF